MVKRLPAAALLCLYVSAASAAERNPDDLMFVSGRGSTAIAAIDTRTDTVVARYAAPGVPQRIVAAGDPGRLVAATQRPRGLHFFDIATGALIRSLDPGFAPSVLQLAAGGGRLAAAGPGRIAVVDMATGTVLRDAAFEGTPSALVFDKAGDFLLIGDAGRERVQILDVRGTTAIRTLDLATGGAGRQGVAHLARTPGGETAIAVHGPGRSTILDLKTWDVVGRLALPGRQERAFPTVNSQYFLVPNRGDRTVSIVSAWTYAESGRLAMAADTTTLTTFLADTVMLAFSRDSRDVEVFDLDRRRRLQTIALPGMPERAVTGPGGLKAYVTFRDREDIAVIDIATLRIAKVIEGIGFQPSDLFSGGALSFCH